MELVVNLEPWPEDSPVSHDSTIIYIKDENKNVIATDSTNNLIYLKEIDIPIGYTYYVVAERQFSLKDSDYDISNINYQTEEFPITNNENDISNMLLSQPVVVEKPYIYFSKEEFNNTSDYITIKSSSYRGTGDGHTFSHWLIKDSEGNVIFPSIRDTENKTSIRVKKSIFQNLSNFEIFCIHCSNNIESPTGNLKVVMNTLNFNLETNINNLYSSGLKLNIKRLNNNNAINVFKILFKHKDEIVKIIDVVPTTKNDLLYVIPNNVLEIKRDMVIEIYGYDTFGNIGKKSYMLDMVSNSFEDNIDKTYEYKMLFTQNIIEGSIPLNLVTDTINGKTFIPNNTGSFDLYNIDNDGSLILNKNLLSLNHLGNIENIFFKYNDNNTILIDCLKNNIPTFMVYTHNLISDTFNLSHILERPDEIVSLGFNNSIEMIKENEFIYSVYGSNELKHYNIETNILTNLNPIPDNNIDASTIIKMDDGNLLILSNKDYKTFIYNIEKNEYRNAMSIPFAGMIGKELKKVDMINGNRILLVNNEESLGEVFLFNIKDYTLNKLSSTISVKNNYTLYKKYNDIFITTTVEKDYINFDKDRIIIEKVI